MTLYRKENTEDVQLTDDEEAAVRAAIVPDGSSGPMLYGQNGKDYVHTDDEAAAIRADWAAARQAEQIKPVPQAITNFQGHAMLVTLGLAGAAQAAINAISDPTQKELAQLAFDKADFRRDSALLLSVAQAVWPDKTADQIAASLDDAFRQANTIAV